MFLLSLPLIEATKSITVDSHTCSLQLHDGTVQCHQSECYVLHEQHYTTSKWSSFHWKWCNYTGRPWNEVVHLWCKRPLYQLWIEACHHCIRRVSVSCTGLLHPHNTSTQLCSWDLWVRVSSSDGSHGCCCIPSCLACFYSRRTLDHLVLRNLFYFMDFLLNYFLYEWKKMVCWKYERWKREMKMNLLRNEI